MENVDPADAQSSWMSIARCRELLGDETTALSDQEIELIRQHADAQGRVLVQIFLENRPTPG